MDWDVEMDDVSHIQDEIIPVQPGSESRQASSIDARSEEGQIVDPSSLDGRSESPTLVPTKIHMRGLDVLTTDDIKSYVAEHFGEVDKVEWIDDTSANLVFKSESTAQEALISLSSLQVADPTQLPPLEYLPGKAVHGKPDVNVQVRVATESDRKQAGAAARSRFYLLHPEYDPEERRRRGVANRSRYRDRDFGTRRSRRDGRDGRDGRDRRRSYGKDNYDDDDDGGYFDASFYDDDENSLASRSLNLHRRREVGFEEKDDGLSIPGSRHNNSRELFPDRQAPGRQRERRRSRSASPTRAIDGDVLRQNRYGAQRVKSRLASENSAKELFPSKPSSSGLGQIDRLEQATRDTQITSPAAQDSVRIRDGTEGNGTGTGFSIKGASTASAKELFPNKFGSNSAKELFAERLEGRGRRRQKAEDLFY